MKYLQVYWVVFCAGSLLALGFFITGFLPAEASTVAELQQKIDERGKVIEELEQEIAQHQAQIREAQEEAQTLSSAIAELDASQRQLQSEIQLTEARIASAEDTIDKLGQEIEAARNTIATHKGSLASVIKDLDSSQSSSLVLQVFSNENLSSMWQTLSDARQLQETVSIRVRELQDLEATLIRSQREQEEARKDLTALRADLEGRRQAVQYNIRERRTLLSETKEEESQYQRIVEEKLAQKRKFERELFEFESQLRYEIDPSRLPEARPGILNWPLDNVFVTQRFGRTTSSERLYVSGSHNGVDFRASVGTPVRAVQSGRVVGTGNTDQYPGCYSYGKWILVEHNNGLSSISAHLSVINVSEGQEVERGQVIGYTGNTGYSTGPHLHLGIYASQGVEVQQYTSSINCKQAFIPLADRRAYLDPMQYFPSF